VKKTHARVVALSSSRFVAVCFVANDTTAEVSEGTNRNMPAIFEHTGTTFSRVHQP